jgi:hypothetical protein
VSQEASSPQLTPPAPPDGSAPETLSGRFQALRSRYARWESGAFFLGGFLFDVFTLGRIDDWLTLVQQGVYLLILGTLLVWDLRYALHLAEPGRRVAKAWRYSEGAIHFLFGSLLSSYALFYFKSASILSSAAFLVVLFALLVANELERFRQLGPVMRFALYSFCLTSYAAYLLPVLLGFIRGWLFVCAVGLAAGVVMWLFRLLQRFGAPTAWVVKRCVAPALGIQVLLLLLYLVQAIPPVPLSLSFIGVYHDVQKLKELGTVYKLSHERPEWKIWHRGDQHFLARPGDSIYVFFSVFAPGSFKDQRIQVQWSYQDPKRGWVEQGEPTSLPLGRGGREEGWRTFVRRTKYHPGRWRADVETQDGRDIGWITLTVEEDTRPIERYFEYELR